LTDVPPPSNPRSINYRLHVLASSLSKGSTQIYVAQFGVGLPEVRILSTLSSHGPLAAHQLAALTAMDKAFISRLLATLSRRTYVAASPADADARRRSWMLTPSGCELVDRLRPLWQRREAIIQADLSPEERVLMADMLDRMFVASEKLRAQETEALEAARRSPPRRRAAPELSGT
jgi:DNA-binding MarR family transcriptional regulator